MADFSSKIPISMPNLGKKKHKYRLYSPSVSSLRLRKVQDLLAVCGVDGILCILGIDSRYNSGTKQLLNYLLFGYCNIQAESISLRLTDESLEDVIIFIKSSSVHVYCNPINYSYLLPYIAHWRNLHLHCLVKDEDDDEIAEEFKIKSFITMVLGCKKIGIPYGNDKTQKSFDPFAIEKWPLIQAFALEGFGGGGFFTMAHEVVDVSENLNSVFGAIDSVTYEQLVTERLSLFQRHCKSVLANVDVESESMENMSKITEGLVGEPIISYYKHGHISESKLNSSMEEAKPFVLFGTNTSKVCLNKARKGLEKCTNTALDGSHHMVYLAKDPRGTLSCIRTYFFGNGFTPLSDTEHSVSIESNKDLRLLIDLYLLSINALLHGIKYFVQYQDIIKAKNAVDSCIKAGLEKKKIDLSENDIDFSIQANDFIGRKVDLQNVNIPSIKMASLFFYDIKSIENPGKVLGSVGFGETFLDSVVKTIDKEKEISLNCQYSILTENISRFTSWMVKEKQAKQEGPRLGKEVVYGDASVFIAHNLYTTCEQGILHLYDKGLMFIHPRFGRVVIPLDTLTKMEFYDGESSSKAAVLILHYQSSMACYYPPQLVNDSHQIVVALLPRTKIFRLFYSDVLPLWKSRDCQPVLQLISEMPKSSLQINNYIKESMADENSTSALTRNTCFIGHLKYSTVSHVPITSQDINVLLQEAKEDKEISTDNNNIELLLTILTGAPGSGKEQLCKTLLSLAKENSKWIVLRNPLRTTAPFDSKMLQTSLSKTVASQKKLLLRMPGRKQIRVILVLPGFTDIIEVIQAISSHPNPDIKRHIKIGAVTCCVDPENMFIQNRFTLPKIMEQCAQGWVNNIVFTSCLDPQNEQLSMVQKLIRSCNPDAAFLLAKGGEVTRSSDVELILSDNAFTSEKPFKTRHLMCPGWSLGLFNVGYSEPQLDEICINLFGPLDKDLFVSKLKAFKAPLNVKDCFSLCTIYGLRGHVHFVDHNTITEVHWTRLNESLTMSTVDLAGMPRPPPKESQNGSTEDPISSYFIVFTGFSLQQDVLKDWLRSCCKPKPEKKPLKTIKDFTNKELENIKLQYKCDPLPEGWFYNGTTYVNLAGHKSIQHPLMDNFIKEYLTGINEEISKHNASISLTPHVDIFKPTH